MVSKRWTISLATMFFLVAASLFFINGNFNRGIVRAEEMSAPGVPNLASPADGAAQKTNDVVLNWIAGTNSSHLAGYELNIVSSALGGPPNTVWVDAPATQYQTTDLPDGEYQWQVRAKDTGGNSSAWSQLRSFLVDTRTPSSPTGIAATAIAGGKSTISWAAVTGAETYRIYRESALVGEVKQATYADSGLNDNKSYKYYVSVLDLAGNESAKGGPATAVPSPAPTPTPASEADAREADSRNVTEIEAGSNQLAAPSEEAAADSEGQVAGATDEATEQGDNAPAVSPADDSTVLSADQIKAQASKFLGQPWWLWVLVAVAVGLGVWLVFRRRNK